MGVADSDSFQYGESLRSLAARKRFRYITFLRVPDILSQESGPTTSRDAYLTAVPYLRKQLETFLNPHINIENEIDGNEDTMLTYQSFVALLAKDMPWRDDFDKNLLQDERRYNQEVKKLAECMVKRLIVSCYKCKKTASFTDLPRHTNAYYMKSSLTAYASLFTCLPDKRKSTFHFFREKPSLG